MMRRLDDVNLESFSPGRSPPFMPCIMHGKSKSISSESAGSCLWQDTLVDMQAKKMKLYSFAMGYYASSKDKHT
jgi:hypothetical protein